MASRTKKSHTRSAKKIPTKTFVGTPMKKIKKKSHPPMKSAENKGGLKVTKKTVMKPGPFKNRKRDKPDSFLATQTKVFK